MAAELARHGVSCRIIDRLPNPLPYCRAIGITPRTLEVWDDMGIADPLIDAGLWIVGTRSFLNHSPAQDVQNDLFGLPYGHLGIPQPETERILAEHLATFGIAVERSVTLTSLKQDSQRVQVELLGPDNSKEAAVFRYVVGCDGANSAVRRLSEIPLEGDQFPFTFMLGDVLDCDLPRGTGSGAPPRAWWPVLQLQRFWSYGIGRDLAETPRFWRLEHSSCLAGWRSTAP